MFKLRKPRTMAMEIIDAIAPRVTIIGYSGIGLPGERSLVYYMTY